MTTTWSRNPRTHLTELGDGSGVLLDMDTRFYFTLNPTAVHVWRLLTTDDRWTLDRLVAATVANFEVDEDDARADIEALLETFVTEGVAKRADDQG